VENLNPEAVEGYSQELKEEIVADTLETMISFKNGTLQYCEGEISDILDEIIEENTKARNALKTIKSSKLKSLQY
jgi:vacuolar-type H+-ATPase subunit H